MRIILVILLGFMSCRSTKDCSLVCNTKAYGSDEPIIVVDNKLFLRDISIIDPTDIRNMVVLNDTMATRTYGSMARNGAIIIETRKGKYKRKIRKCKRYCKILRNQNYG